MADLADGESMQVQESGSSVYKIKNVGGVYSCSCPAWRNQSTAIEVLTCKHIRKLRGEAAELARTGSATPVTARKTISADGEESSVTETPLLLAESWDGLVDVTGWWISEKLDGVRAYWNGSQFLSRLGNTFAAPEWFTAGLPSVALDGELWIGRKQFQRTVSIVRRKDQSDHWKQVRFVVFDAPGIAEAFETRMDRILDLIGQNRHPFAVAHAHSLCRGIAHLKEELVHIEAIGGEGLMLRQPSSLYTPGRSSTLLKVKTFHDAEARVIGHQKGAGRHKGRLGALVVQLADGTEFSVGTGFSDAERGDPPPVGSTITFRYQELSDGGVPRFPSYVGVRRDQPAWALIPTPTETAPIQLRSSTLSVPITDQPLGSFRSCELRDGKSDKFWEITTDGLKVTVRYGRRGTSGQSQSRSFDSQSLAQTHVEQLIADKTKKGYKERKNASTDG